jgi:hypothetical protein
MLLYVAVSVSGLKPMSTHAEHIHAGTCGSNGPIKYPLANLVADARGNATLRRCAIPVYGQAKSRFLSKAACLTMYVLQEETGSFWRTMP